jgi:small subunit ribosomal protein S16
LSVKIRLTRVGSKKQPYYRIVVTDSRSPRDGRFIENIGTYDPKTEPSDIKVDKEKALDWLKKGAQPSNTVKKIFEIVNLQQ